MDNVKIVLKLHFYQPWWQFPSVLENIVNQTYRPILQLVRNTDGFCFTANVNAVLLQLLEKHGFEDVIYGFQEAVKNGKIELVGSTAQHPILPLISDRVKAMQIEEDEKIKKSFGIEKNCRGLFLPEMAFSRHDIGLMRDCGFRWSVVDDVPYCATFNCKPPFDNIVMLDGFKTFMRSGHWSNTIARDNCSFDEIKAKMSCEIPDWTKGVPSYLILAMDAETFGHHHPNLINIFLEPMIREWVRNGKICSLESLEGIFPWRNMPFLPDGSWSTSTEDVRRNDPYPLWKSHMNKHHQDLWELTNLAIQYFERCPQDCLKITSSCHQWWISGRPYWNPEFMKFGIRGRSDLGVRGAIDIVREFGFADEIKRAQDLYDGLIRLN